MKRIIRNSIAILALCALPFAARAQFNTYGETTVTALLPVTNCLGGAGVTYTGPWVNMSQYIGQPLIIAVVSTNATFPNGVAFSDTCVITTTNSLTIYSNAYSGNVTTTVGTALTKALTFA